MFIGHFAVGLAAKRAAPRAPLPVLLAAPQAPDILWPIFVATGIEHARIVPGATEGPHRRDRLVGAGRRARGHVPGLDLRAAAAQHGRDAVARVRRLPALAARLVDRPPSRGRAGRMMRGMPTWRFAAAALLI